MRRQPRDDGIYQSRSGLTLGDRYGGTALTVVTVGAGRPPMTCGAGSEKGVDGRPSPATTGSGSSNTYPRKHVSRRLRLPDRAHDPADYTARRALPVRKSASSDPRRRRGQHAHGIQHGILRLRQRRIMPEPVRPSYNPSALARGSPPSAPGSPGQGLPTEPPLRPFRAARQPGGSALTDRTRHRAPPVPRAVRGKPPRNPAATPGPSAADRS